MAALEAGKPHEIEDVLASIRRLVSQSTVPQSAGTVGGAAGPKAVADLPAVVTAQDHPESRMDLGSDVVETSASEAVSAPTFEAVADADGPDALSREEDGQSDGVPQAFLLTPARRIIPEIPVDAPISAEVSIAADPDPAEAGLAGAVDFVDDLAHELARLENTISQLAASVIAESVTREAASTAHVQGLDTGVDEALELDPPRALYADVDDGDRETTVGDAPTADAPADDLDDVAAFIDDVAAPGADTDALLADDLSDDETDDSVSVDDEDTVDDDTVDSVVTPLVSASRFAIHRGATDPNLRPTVEPDVDDDLDDTLNDDDVPHEAIGAAEVALSDCETVVADAIGADPVVADPLSVAQASPTVAAMIDEDTLRPLVARLIREELRGVLGERITQNVRKLVRREMQRSMLGHDPD